MKIINVGLMLCLLSTNANAFFFGDAMVALGSVQSPMSNMHPKIKVRVNPKHLDYLVCSSNNGLDCINETGDVVGIIPFVESKGYTKGQLYHIYLKEGSPQYFRITVIKNGVQRN